MELQFLFTLAAFLLFLVFLLKQAHRSRNPSQKLIPGPWKLPVIGNLHNMIGLQPHRALRELAKKHGPLMQLQMGEISTVVISSPELAKEVMKTHDLIFAQRPIFLAFKILYEKVGMPIALAPYGEYWRQMRRLCLLELLSNKRVRSFSRIREDETSKFIESIRSSANSPINLSKAVSSYTCTVTCRAAFGNRFKDQEEFVSLTKKISKLSGGFALAEGFPSLNFLHVITGLKAKLVKVHGEADKILDNLVNEHRENRRMNTISENSASGEDDLVDVLLRVQETESLGFPITTNSIKAVIWNIFAGGTDSSSTTIIWAMSELMKNPRIMEKAQTELREAVKGKSTICEEDIQELNYLKLIIKETLRLHPPNPLLLPRESRESCEIKGYEIPVKTKVTVNVWAMGRDPEYWKEAESFIPERFSDGSIDFKGNDFEYIPFGAGRRICPGIAFALANIELPLSQLLYNFDWEIPGGIAPQDLDMSESFGSIVSRKNDLCLIATPYSPPDHP